MGVSDPSPIPDWPLTEISEAATTQLNGHTTIVYARQTELGQAIGIHIRNKGMILACFTPYLRRPKTTFFEAHGNLEDSGTHFGEVKEAIAIEVLHDRKPYRAISEEH